MSLIQRTNAQEGAKGGVAESKSLWNYSLSPGWT
jgi:hypothetical protein